MKHSKSVISVPVVVVVSSMVFAACMVADEEVEPDEDSARVSMVGSGAALIKVGGGTGSGSGSGSGSCTGSASGSGSGSGFCMTPAPTMKCCAGKNTNNYCPKDEKKDGVALQYNRYNGYWIDTEGKACKDVDGYGYEVTGAEGKKDVCTDYEEWNHDPDGCTHVCNHTGDCPGQ